MATIDVIEASLGVAMQNTYAAAPEHAGDGMALLAAIAAGLAEQLRLMREPGLPVPEGWYVATTEYRDAAGGRILVQSDGRCTAWIYTRGVGMFDALDVAADAVRKARHA